MSAARMGHTAACRGRGRGRLRWPDVHGRDLSAVVV